MDVVLSELGESDSEKGAAAAKKIMAPVFAMKQWRDREDAVPVFIRDAGPESYFHLGGAGVYEVSREEFGESGLGKNSALHAACRGVESLLGDTCDLTVTRSDASFLGHRELAQPRPLGYGIGDYNVAVGEFPFKVQLTLAPKAEPVSK